MITTTNEERHMNNGPFKDDGFQHYYLRTESGQPYGVVAVAPGEEAGKVHRGISLCSTIDTWDRVAGRRKAVSRIKKAMGTGHSSDAVMNMDAEVVRTLEAERVGLLTDASGTVWKSHFNALATDKEKVIIENLHKKQLTQA